MTPRRQTARAEDATVNDAAEAKDVDEVYNNFKFR